jgi:hypothetical protein
MNLVWSFKWCTKSGFSIRQSYTKQLIYLCRYRHVACVSRSLHYGQPGLGHDGSQLVIRHIDGSLELGGVSGAEGGWASITTVQDSL